MRKMIAYCGLDCEKCDAYIATVRDDQALREKNAKACGRHFQDVRMIKAWFSGTREKNKSNLLF